MFNITGKYKYFILAPILAVMIFLVIIINPVVKDLDHVTAASLLHIVMDLTASAFFAGFGAIARILSHKKAVNAPVMVSGSIVGMFTGIMAFLVSRYIGWPNELAYIVSGGIGWAGPHVMDLLVVKAANKAGFDINLDKEDADGNNGQNDQGND